MQTTRQAPMIARNNTFACGCCRNNKPVKDRRAAKRREKQAWKKEVSR